MSKVFSTVAKVALPVLAIASGVGALGVAATAGASLSAGAMIAGGGLSLLGVATGNKSLSKIGGLLTLGGGIGSMFTGGLTNPMDVFKGGGASDGGMSGLKMADSMSFNPGGSGGGLINAGSSGSLGGDALFMPANTPSTLSFPAAGGNLGLNLSNSMAPVGGGTMDSILGKLNKYSSITDFVGGALKSKAENDLTQAAIDAKNRDNLLAEQKYATQQANLAAPTTIGIEAVPNTSGAIYQGMDRNPDGSRNRYK